MNAINLAKSAYSNATATVRSASNTEYDAFARITAGLKMTAGQEMESFPRLVEAVHKNRQLWSLLATDVSSDDNQLPKELRAQIFSLAEFVRTHSRKILKGEPGVEALIEINTTVMRGLKSLAESA